MEVTSETSHQLPTSVAFYLPQFHPIAENDDWWGTGFTEWTNVRRARPVFRGHHQPKTPGALGYYDLRDSETREVQAQLARRYGIGAFCYYHYWFSGRRLLEHPFDAVLNSGKPNFPFMLCWANENWTRAWDGGSDQILVRQTYSDQDDLKHIRALLPAFEDPRYVRLDGRPVFLIYRAGFLPDPRRTAEIWQREAERLGCAAPLLCHVEAFADEARDPSSIGFDAAVEFAPDFPLITPPPRRGVASRLIRYGLAPRTWHHRIVNYESVVDAMLAKPPRPHPWYRAMTPGWDNTPRRPDGALIVRNNTPESFQRWATELFRDGVERGSPFVFINAWNEWGEGAYLEPDDRWDHAFLSAHLDARTEAVSNVRELPA